MGVNIKQDKREAIEEGEIVRGCGQGYNGVGRRDKAMIRVGKNVEVTNGVMGWGRIGQEVKQVAIVKLVMST